MATQSVKYEVQPEWVHVQYAETSQFREVYGFASSQGMVNLEGIRFVPKGKPSKTLMVYMHPASTLQLLPMPRAMTEHGMHVLCAGSRYAKNDTPLIFEKVILDLGAYIRHAKEAWGYEKIVIVGWSGGGSLSLFYQSQAEGPNITQTPAGDPVDIAGAKLIPGDGMIFQAAHVSRAVLLADWIDPSVRNEDDPDDRIVELDIYNPRNPNKPPYTADYLAHFRAAQLVRLRRRTAWVKETLARLKKDGGKELERGFVTHRTMAEPRFLDPAIEPNDRKPGTCFLGDPETVNSGPISIGRFSTLRAWLSQWSLDDTNAHGEHAASRISVPLLAIENTADDAVPQPHTRRIFDAAGSKDKTFLAIKKATHYYVGQPELLQQAVDTCMDWMASRKLIVD
ncbi:MAG: alpha/beta hydrolase [Betaproteobacteria bacterium]|nr:alpha/beta hydrolase [Betaproteobacteria bacterium]